MLVIADPVAVAAAEVPVVVVGTVAVVAATAVVDRQSVNQSQEEAP